MHIVDKNVRCIANNMEKYITFSTGGLHIIDSLNFLLTRLDKSVVASIPDDAKDKRVNISSQNLGLVPRHFPPLQKWRLPYELEPL